MRHLHRDLRLTAIASLLFAMGHATDRYGTRAGMAGVLIFLLAGTAFLPACWSPVVWGVAMACCGACESLRLVAAGMVNDSFGDMPTAWGFAIFDTIMGLPMACGAVVGGLLFRAGHALPLVLVMLIAAALLVLLAVQRSRGTHARGGRRSPSAPD